MKLVLDLGSGTRKYREPGAKTIGIDAIKKKGVDVIHDLEKTPLPFKSNTFDKIVAVHTLEHI